MESIGVILNMIASSMRTEELLQELKRSNAELEAQAGELNDKARLLEQKNTEVELASRSLEEKAEQLQLISKYKSEFLANMSHELRTPLNSLLILSKMLAENKDGNLTAEQVEFANTVYTSGNDLLALINEILDLSKVEAGKMPIDPGEVPLDEVRDYLEQTLPPRRRAEGARLRRPRWRPELPRDDPHRRQPAPADPEEPALERVQVHRRRARSTVTVDRARSPARPTPASAIAFAVADTGIGIAREKQKLIFEAFQQADGTTSRKYGGTGLGLTISREIARLLGGTIEVESTPGAGSTFTLVLPLRYAGPGAGRSRAARPRARRRSRPSPLPSDARSTGAWCCSPTTTSATSSRSTACSSPRQMKVLHAENGREAIRLLEENPAVDLVLMDTMMPEMDGLSAIQRDPPAGRASRGSPSSRSPRRR